MRGLSGTQAKLLRDYGRKIRRAVDTREQAMQKVLTEYDKAVEHGDNRDIEAATLVMLFQVAMDPAQEAFKEYSTVATAIKNAEKASI